MIRVFLLLFAINGAVGQATFRVFDGFHSEPNEFPYMVSMRDSREHQHLCGGSIISKRTVLTGGHCFNLPGIGRDRKKIYIRPLTVKEIYVWAGSSVLCLGGTQYNIERIIHHPLWTFQRQGRTKSNMNFDIGMAITRDDIIMTESVSVIPLDFEFVAAGLEVDFTGWGLTSYGVNPDVLQKVKLKTIRNRDCWSYYHEEEYSRKALKESDTKTALCTSTDEGRGMCFGDSGGPLVLNNKQVAVAARVGYDCGDGDPDIFIRLSRLKKFILKKMVE